MGVSLVGVLFYFSVRRLRRQPQKEKDSAHKGRSPGSRGYEKPELPGEDAYKEMDAAERRTAELAGDGIRLEMDGTPARHTGSSNAI